MTHTEMKTLTYPVLITLLVAGAVSCSKTSVDIPKSDGAIVLVPGIGSSTKSVAEGTSLPDDFTISLSAYHVNESAPESSGNYLTGEPFTETGTSWSASPVVYWPMGGYLDFLALTSDRADLLSTANWYDNDVSRSVELSVPDASCLSSEIMYSCASSKNSSERSVRMNFSHSQAWVQIRIAASEVGTTRIDSIVIRKAYLGGVLRVDNGVRLAASWDYHGFFRKDYVFPASKNLILSTDEFTMDVLLPEQDACDITIWYTQKNSDEPSWENYTRRTSFTATAGGDPWYAGARTLYTMTVLRQVAVKASVHGWDDTDRNITIE